MPRGQQRVERRQQREREQQLKKKDKQENLQRFDFGDTDNAKLKKLAKSWIPESGDTDNAKLRKFDKVRGFQISETPTTRS